MQYDLLGSPRDLDLSQILTLTFLMTMRWQGKHDGVKVIALSCQNGSYHRKTVSLKNAVFDLSWPLTPKPLVLGEMTPP